jgi:hypothetical protein
MKFLRSSREKKLVRQALNNGKMKSYLE